MNYLTHWYITASHDPDTPWTLIGFVGTGLFAMRFLVQWISSERKGHSVVPVAFWYFSIVGGAISLVYALHLHAWPLILGQGVPLVIYARNLWMISRDHATASKTE